jgi:predicted GIY-YIG superfamily endonuclease
MKNKFHYTKQEFNIEITETAIKPVGSPKFVGISKDAFKIYIIKYDNGFLYIGITKTYLSSRFSLGFNATKKVGHNGYHGYKWIKSHRGKHLNLIVITFPNMTAKGDRELVETIEAELVFQARHEYGKWPECQNEIHFYNNGADVIAFSEKLFKEII